MRLFDIAKMAIHNLRRRPFRSLLNLLGITLGSTAILLTAAGSDGVKRSLHSLLENSEFSRKVIVNYDSLVRESDLDESQWRIDVELDQERKDRLETALKNYVLQVKRQELGRWRLIDVEALEKLESIENTKDVVPAVRLNFDLIQGEFNQSAVGSGVSPKVFGLPDRIIAGEMIGEHDLEHVLIHELLAFQMGFVTQAELDSLIGSEITTVFTSDGSNKELAKLLSSLEKGNLEQVLSRQPELLAAIKATVGGVELGSLTDVQKKLVRSGLKAMIQEGPGKARTIERTFKIKGVYHSMGESDLFSVFKKFTFDSAQPVLFHFKTATELQLNSGGRKTFYSATIYVDSFKNLQPVEERIEQLGFRTSSARDMLSQIDKRIDEIGWVIYFIAICVLVITAFAISNALIVSVMERTQEFGIMKSLGARTKDIVTLMLFEGGLLGAVGATFAVLLSILLGKFGQGYLQQHLEGRVNHSLSGDLISFTPASIALAVLGAIVVCSLASIVPAWRAARLDPIVAMQKT